MSKTVYVDVGAGHRNVKVARRVVDGLFEGEMVWATKNIGVGAVVDDVAPVLDMVDVAVFVYTYKDGLSESQRSTFSLVKEKGIPAIVVGYS